MKKQTPKMDSLIGKFFHSFTDGKLSWQGRITAEPAPGYFLVQLFDWFVGSPNDKKIIPIAQMIGWTFYDDADDWREAGDLKALEQREAGSLPELTPARTKSPGTPEALHATQPRTKSGNVWIQTQRHAGKRKENDNPYTNRRCKKTLEYLDAAH